MATNPTETQMVVRCKFKVDSVTPADADGSVSRVQLYPVYSGSPENESFFKYTPSGSIGIGTINAEAAKQFEVGKEFYVDFIPAAGN